MARLLRPGRLPCSSTATSSGWRVTWPSAGGERRVCPAHRRGSRRGAGDYLDELTARSRELRLDERREWHRLLHYIPNLAWPGVHSLADAPGFFLARNGKTNPQAELEATLASFFSATEETGDSQNPQCRFIARYAWLDRELAFDPSRLPPQPCKRFNAWRESLDPQGVTLVFPTAFLNNPS